jgi:hypothetical protein
LADLVIAANLIAADECTPVVVEVRQEETVGPFVVGPGKANIAAGVKSGPTEYGTGGGGGVDLTARSAECAANGLSSIAALARYLRSRFMRCTLDCENALASVAAGIVTAGI